MNKEIPKTDGNQRKLGIACYEDKLVQMMTNKILTAVYENEFHENLFGFREGRSCHNALSKVNEIVMSKRINYVVEIDIEKFFDSAITQD